MSMDKFNTLFDPGIVNDAKKNKASYEKLQEATTDFQNEFDLENAYIMSKVDGEEVILVLGNSDDYRHRLLLQKTRQRHSPQRT